MKKYKTWEVYEKLTVNKSLKFRRVSDGKEYRMNDFDSLLPSKVIAGETCCWQGIKLLDEWELIQQPVDFLTAVKAYSKGKTIRCEIGEETRIYDYKVGYGMTNINHYAITVGEILNGTWYVEDSHE